MIELPREPVHRQARTWRNKAILWAFFDFPVARVLFDIRCGLHSGMKPCCVLWFVTGWRWMEATRLRRMYSTIIDWQSDNLTERGKPHFDHVPCPLCLARGRAVVLRDCECLAELLRLTGEPLTTEARTA